MKNTLLKILVLCTAVCAMLCAFTACEDNNAADAPIHKHSFVDFTVNPTCAAAGYTLHKCACGEEYKDNFTDAFSHNYINGKCALCGAADPNYTEPVEECTHDYAWTTVKEPTETEEGVKTGVCKKCGDTITQSIPVLIHEHRYSQTIVAPTCTSGGFTLFTCSCGREYKDNFTNAKGHDYEWTTVKEPTETEEGQKDGVCKFCDNTITRPIPTLNHEHNYIITVVPATCTAGGYTLHKCSCEDEYITDETLATGHNFDGWITTKEPTCTEKGEKTATCTRCPETKTEEISTLGHNFGAASVTKEPTCTGKGEKTIVCARCGDIKTQEISELGHNYGEYITTKEPTCTEIGIKVSTCARCKDERTQNIPATGHSYKSEYEFDDAHHWQETTCGHTGAIVKVEHILDENEICTVCGYDAKITTALKYVEINNGTEYAVDELTNDDVKVVYIPDTYNGKPVTKINDMAFYKKTNIEKVIISDNVIDIGASAFYYCSNLQTVKLPKNLTEIKSGVFSGCSRLTCITIPDSVTDIGSYAFSQCIYLKSIIIPDRVISIGECAFSTCRNLYTVTIGKSVTSIREDAFATWSGGTLKNIYYTGKISEWVQISGLDNLMTDGYDNKNLYIENSLITDESLEGITEIKPYAFCNCGSLMSLTIPDSVTSIGVCAFSNCPCVKTTKGLSYVDKWLIKADTTIKSANIKADTVGIANCAFEYCRSLTIITIPDSVQSIGSYAFYYCSSFSIYYNGTAEEWEKISIGNYNNDLTSDRRYYYSETEPELNESGTSYNGKYWHYDTDGITPVIWVKEN